MAIITREDVERAFSGMDAVKVDEATSAEKSIAPGLLFCVIGRHGTFGPWAAAVNARTRLGELRQQVDALVSKKRG